MGQGQSAAAARPTRRVVAIKGKGKGRETDSPPPPPPPVDQVTVKSGPVKRVLARNVKKEPMAEPPADATVFFFETEQGQRVCWKIATQSAHEFATSGIAASSQQFFKGATLRVFFPVKDGYYATKMFRGVGTLTFERVLKCIEFAASAAVAYHLQHDVGQSSVTTEDVTKSLRRVAVCHLLLRSMGGSNQVYVRLSGSI
jgi:hypothetical protein